MVLSIAVSFFATFTAILEARKARHSAKQQLEEERQRQEAVLKKAEQHDYNISNADLPSGFEIIDAEDGPRGRSAAPPFNHGAIAASATRPVF
ncbi:hypothetical protein AC579_6368 [Pseudocercospora musae]|uniref:Uncharacterized protein n=1 Tax=Pseudocercospora musae TaxID=113226 RepID=A0A139HH17_9PEZI|nr:hypothetical protein AC579_6368 [Pseudocercospora musae]